MYPCFMEEKKRVHITEKYASYIYIYSRCRIPMEHNTLHVSRYSECFIYYILHTLAVLYINKYEIPRQSK